MRCLISGWMVRLSRTSKKVLILSLMTSLYSSKLLVMLIPNILKSRLGSATGMGNFDGDELLLFAADIPKHTYGFVVRRIRCFSYTYYIRTSAAGPVF